MPQVPFETFRPVGTALSDIPGIPVTNHFRKLRSVEEIAADLEMVPRRELERRRQSGQGFPS